MEENNNLTQLHTALVNKGAVTGSVDDFKTYLSDDKNRNDLFEALKKKGAVTGSFNDFTSWLGMGENTTAAAQPTATKYQLPTFQPYQRELDDSPASILSPTQLKIARGEIGEGDTYTLQPGENPEEFSPIPNYVVGEERKSILPEQEERPDIAALKGVVSQKKPLREYVADKQRQRPKYALDPVGLMQHEMALTRLAKENGIATDGFENLNELGEDAMKIYALTPQGKADKQNMDNAAQLAYDDFTADYLKNGSDPDIKAQLELGRQRQLIEEDNAALAKDIEAWKAHPGTEQQGKALNARIKALNSRIGEYEAAVAQSDKAQEKVNEAFHKWLENDDYYNAVAQQYEQNYEATMGDWLESAATPLYMQMTKDEIAKMKAYLDDESLNLDYRQRTAIKRRVRDAEAWVKAAEKNGWLDKTFAGMQGKGAGIHIATMFRSMGNAIDFDLLDFGIGEAIDDATLRRISEKVRDQGEASLTPEERAVLLSDEALGLTKSVFNVDESAWNAGANTAEMLPFIVELWLSGGANAAIKAGVKGAVKGGAKGFRTGLKAGWKAAMKPTASQLGRLGEAGRFAPKSVGQVAKEVGMTAAEIVDNGLFYALTTGSGHTISQLNQYMTPVIDANFDFGTGKWDIKGIAVDEDGNIKGGDKFGIAALKAIGMQAIEGAFEMLGEKALQPLLDRAGYGLRKLMGGQGRAMYKPYLRVVDDWIGHGALKNVSGFGTEYAEELAGSVARVITGLSTWDQEFNKQNLADTAYGLMPAQVAFAILGGGRMVGHARRSSQAKELLEEYAPEQAAFYDRVAKMSAYDGADMLDRKTLEILKDIDTKQKNGTLTEQDQRKAAAQLGMIFTMQEQLYMDEASAYMTDKDDRRLYENITSNINKQTGMFTVARWQHDGTTEYVPVVSTEGEKGTVRLWNGKTQEVNLKDIEIMREQTPEEALQWVNDNNTLTGYEYNDQTTPTAGSVYYDADGNIPIVPRQGEVMVTEVADNGDVTFETANGTTRTMNQRQFFEYMRALRDNFETTAGLMAAWRVEADTRGKTTAENNDPQTHYIVGREARMARRTLAQAIGEQRMAELESMDGESLIREYLKADKATQDLMYNWMQNRVQDSYTDTMNQRRVQAMAEWKQRIGRLPYDNGNVTTAVHNGNIVIVEDNDGQQAAISDMNGNKSMVQSGELSNMQDNSLDSVAAQATAQQQTQLTELERAYNGTAFQAGQEYTIWTDTNGEAKKAIVVSVNEDGTISYATEYGFDKDGNPAPVARSVKVATEVGFRDMTENARQDRAEQARGERQAEQQRSDMGSLRNGQRVTIMDGGHPVQGTVNMPYTGSQFVFTDGGKLVKFDTMDDLKKSMQDADNAMKAARQASEEAVKTRIEELAKAMPNVNIRVAMTPEELRPDAQELVRKGGAVEAYYDPDTNEVVFYAPVMAQYGSDIDAKIMHEVVIHYGLKNMLGADNYKNLCRNIFASVMDDEERQRYVKYVKDTHPNWQQTMTDDDIMAAAADEWLAFTYESRNIDEVKHQSVLQMIVDAIMDLFRKAGVNIDRNAVMAALDQLVAESRDWLRGEQVREEKKEEPPQPEKKEEPQPTREELIAQAVQQAQAFAEQGDPNYVKDNLSKAREKATKARGKKPSSTDATKRAQQIEKIKQEREQAEANLKFWEDVQAVLDQANEEKQALQNEADQALQQFKDKVAELSTFGEETTTEQPTDFGDMPMPTNEEAPFSVVSYSIVTDPQLIEQLEQGEKETGYRTVALNPDGSLGSPMADKLGKKGEKSVKTSPFAIGQWEQADENPDMATDKGKINLIKPNGRGSVGSVDYNPYIHIRPNAINTQFTQAWMRPELVYVETQYPTSELTSGYHAEKAKLTTGRHDWNGGELILSRYDKPMRIVPWEEVADLWAEQFKGTGVTFDIVTPQMLPLLAERGVEILPPKKAAGEKAMQAYEQWKNGSDVRFSITQQITNEQGEIDYDRVTNLAENITNDGASMGGLGVQEPNGRATSRLPRIYQSTSGMPAAAAEIIARASYQKIGGERSAEGRMAQTPQAVSFRADTRKAIESWAKDQGYWYDEPRLTDGYTEIEGGTESRVFVNTDKTKVRKLTSYTAAYGDYMQRLMENVEIFNATFPDAAYEVIGFGQDNNGNLAAVVEQPYIEGEKVSDIFRGWDDQFGYISNAMSRLGFRPIDNDGTYTNGTAYASDINADNMVVDGEGNPHIIDAVMSLMPEQYSEPFVLYSVANANQAIFVSNAARAVEGIKQEKATPEQWLKMIEKQGGLKAGEDKWLGLSEWLKGSKAKTLTKQEVLDFIRQNMIQIEETGYANTEEAFKDSEVYKEFKRLGGTQRAFDEMVRRYGDDFGIAFGYDYYDGLYVSNNDASGVFLGVNPINSTRLDYTTSGLDNKREIALTIPTIEPWNESDEIHFGDAGGGRAIAWIRFGETTDADGNRVLVIDEIQSKRHQEGREKGYRQEITYEDYEKAQEEWDGFKTNIEEKYHGYIHDIMNSGQATEAERAQYDRYQAIFDYIEKGVDSGVGVPAAPFERNWHELAMKRMLRLAAEEGYDKVAWTTGEQQGERYDLSKQVEKISWNKTPTEEEEGKIFVSVKTENGYPIKGNLTPKEIEEQLGKEIAEKIVNGGDYGTLEGDGLKVGGEGMKGFYDKMIPSFMNKYGRQWGVKVGEVTMPNLEEGYQTMHSIDVTDAMKESVMEGQVMFSVINPQGEIDNDRLNEVIQAVQSGQGSVSRIPSGLRQENESVPAIAAQAIAKGLFASKLARLGKTQGSIAQWNEGATGRGASERVPELEPQNLKGTTGIGEQDREEVRDLIKQWAQDNGYWFDEERLQAMGDEIKGGSESRVFRSEDGTTIAKSTAPYNYQGYVQLVIESMEMFGKVFPNTPYTIIGFSEDKDGNLCVVATQPYVQGMSLDEYAAKQGWYDEDGYIDYDKKMEHVNEKMKEQYGLDLVGAYGTYENETYHVFDVHRGNYIVDDNGDVYVIDADISLNNESDYLDDGVRFSVVFGGNSGYVGYSKSKRAVGAEERGLRNKSQMDSSFADEVNDLIQEKSPGAPKVTLKQIKDSLDDIQADEWHHTSKYGNRTNYYSAETVAEYLRPETEEEKTSREQREAKEQERERLSNEIKPLEKEFLDYIWETVSNDGTGRYKASNGYVVEIHRGLAYPFNRVIDSNGGYLEWYDFDSDKEISDFNAAIKEANNRRTEVLNNLPDRMKEIRERIKNLYDERSKIGDSLRFSVVTPQQDADYMEAVNRGDMETAQRMVDEAARKAGYETYGLHGTKGEFTVFDKKKIGSANDEGWLGRGFYFWDANNRDYAVQYGAGGKVLEVFLSTQEPYPISNNEMETLIDASDNHDVETIENFTSGLENEGYDSVVDTNGQILVFNPNQIKSADPVTYDDEGNVIPLSKRFNKRNEDIRYSVANANQTIFVSNAARAVEGIKQEKATPEQWLKMVEKQGGLKAGEDKWLGLSQWLKGSEAKTLTKQEVLDFINENAIKIEETRYIEQNGDYRSNENYQRIYDEFKAFLEDGKREIKSDNPNDYVNWAYNKMVEKYGEPFRKAFYISTIDETNFWLEPETNNSWYENDFTEEALRFLGKRINAYRLKKTTEGLENKREIALTVPTIEPWNEGDKIHFGDAGEGRAVAWARFGDTTDEQGNRVLVIDEIQSKRHQEGREKGYRQEITYEDYEKAQEEWDGFKTNIEEKYHGYIHDIMNSGQATEAERAQYDRYQAIFDYIEKGVDSGVGVPAAPFERNWHELAMKRMLRLAAEEGYDKVAWTTGEQQAARYDLSKELTKLSIRKNADGTYNVEGKRKGDNSGQLERFESNVPKDELANVVGKEIARQAIEYNGIRFELEGDNLRIGGEGMKGFYDKMLPSFMNKYGRQWGVKVGEVTLPNLEEGYQTMHSIDVNDAMKESVMQGQVMFSVAGNENNAIFADIINENGELNYDKLNEAIRIGRNELGQTSRIPQEKIRRENETIPLVARTIARGVREANLAEVWSEDRAKERTRELIKQWAKRSGHWYDEARLTEGATEGRGGTESRVFVTNDGSTVRKLTSAVFSNDDVEPYIESLQLFGTIFPETAYEIKGFGENDKGELCVVSEQPYIRGVSLRDSGIDNSLELIRNHMSDLGFREDGVNSFTDGIFRVDDVNRTNVIVAANGDLFVIDAFVELEDESLYNDDIRYSFVARNVQSRLGFTEEQRRQLLAAETEDVAREDQLVMFAGDPVLYSVARNADTPKEKMEMYDALVKSKLSQTETKPILGGRVNVPVTSDFMGRTLNGAYQSIFDGAIAIKRLQTVIGGKNGVKDAENAYLMEIARASRAKYLTDQAEKKYLQPMMKAIAALTGKQDKKGFYKAMRDVELYVLAKSGLERNDWFWNEAKKTNPNAPLEDKSGLTALAAQFGETDFTAFAQRLVANYESKHGQQKIDNLWNAIREMSHNILDTEAEGLLISTDLADNLKKRWKYYVPMRGFDEPVTSSIYSYDPSSANIRFENPFKKIGGRVSLADNPFVNLWRMTESAINLKGKNEVGLALLTLASNHSDNGLLRVGQSWETKVIDSNGNETWNMAYPDLSKVAQADIPRAIDAFQKEMMRKAKTGDARPSSRTAGGMRIYPKDFDQHTLKVTVAGQTVDLYLMGNPAAFQALNPKGKAEWMNNLSALTRGLSGLMTTYNPVFIVRNSMRDLGTAMIITYTRDGLGGMANMVGQWFGNAGKLYKLTRGKSSGDATIDRYWQEFLQFGGETGFTRSLAMEKARDEFMKDMRNATRKGIDPLGVFKAYGKWMENHGNRYAEDITRFAVFCASRKRGKSAMQAAADAKNTTANFNKKGQSGFARFMTSNFAFFNAALQGLNTTMHAYKDNPGRALAASAFTAAFSMAVPYVNMLLLAAYGDDDDWLQFENMTQFTGNTHLVIYIPKAGFLTLPYPQDFVPLTALGNIIWRNAAGMTNLGTDDNSIVENIMLQWASTVADLLPVNAFEEGFGKIEDWKGMARAIAPTWLSPVADIMLNRNYMGSEIRHKHWTNNGQKDIKPYWAEYDRERNWWAYDLAKLMAGGDEYRAGAAWRNVDPRQIIHLVEGYGGGTVKLISDALVYGWEKVTGENPSINQSPFIKKFWIQPQPEKYEGNLTGKLYEMRNYQREMEQELKSLNKELQQAEADGNEKAAEQRRKRIDEIQNSVDWQILKDYDLDKMTEQWRDERNAITANEELSEEGKQEQVRNLTYDKASFLDGIWESYYLNGKKSNWFSDFYYIKKGEQE